MKKYVHPASRKPEKAAWAKMGIPVDRKPGLDLEARVLDFRGAYLAHLLVFLSDSKTNSSLKIVTNKALQNFQRVFMWKELSEEERLQATQMNPQFFICDFKWS